MRKLIKLKMSDYDERRLMNLYASSHIIENGCWEWLKAKDKNGYGITSYGSREDGSRKTWKAHRLIYFLLKGEIPNGMLICHSCDNPSCINPNHIFVGTPKANSQDREKKGRGRTQNQRGENNASCVLTESTVLQIREMYAKGLPVCDLSWYFNLNYGTVSKIVHRTRWRHI